MNQFDKNIIVKFKEDNIPSLKEALGEYRELLDSDRAFLKGFMGMFNVEFRVETDSGVRRLNGGDLKDSTTLERALSFGPGGSWTTKALGDEDEVYISEALFFALALEQEELKPDVVETAKTLVAAMGRYNNTDAVWVDDMRLFGVDALYLVAE
ncbi:MAG: hypothetical protein PQJ60_07395, partial [Spirochaetales bacterium]|nr:hypothetical protein [Spirochaetales bacterium]